MTTQTVVARVMEGEEVLSEASVVYDFGDTLEDSVSLFGADVVHKRFVASVTVDLQGTIRRLTTEGKDRTALSGKELQVAIDEWKPGVAKTRKSKTEKAMAIVEGMTTEEKLALLSELSGEEEG